MNFYFKKLEKEKESAKNRHDMNARGVEIFSNTFEDKGRRPHALRGPGARARARARALSTRRFSRVFAFIANYWSCPRIVVAKITVGVLP